MNLLHAVHKSSNLQACSGPVKPVTSPVPRPSSVVRTTAVVVLWLCLTPWLHGHAQTRPAAQILPPETLAFATIPSAETSRAAWMLCPGYKAWSDPAFAHVRKTSTARFDVSIAGWVMEASGLDLGEVFAHAEGQVTLAWIGSPWLDHTATNQSGWIFLLDAGANAPRLRSLWHAVANTLLSTRTNVTTTNYADAEFLVIPPRPDSNSVPLAHAQQPPAPPPPPAGSNEPTQPSGKQPTASTSPADRVWMGVADHLLLVASGPGPVRAVLERHRSTTNATLAATAAFRAAHTNQSQLPPAIQGWINLQELSRAYLHHLANQPKSPTHGNVLLPSVPRLFHAAGISALRSLTFAGYALPTGLVLRAQLAVPEPDRKGLFSAFRLTDGPTQPPAFVPANITRFQRWRLDGPRAWSGIERMLSDLSPPLSGVLDLSLNALGKDQDATFDFRKSFVEALGDDWMFLEYPAVIATPPVHPAERIILIGTSRPDDLQKGVVAAASLLPAADAREQMREITVADHKIKSLPLDSIGPDAAGVALHFATHGNYVAFSHSLAALTNLIQRAPANNTPGAPLQHLDLLAQQLGPYAGGIFVYENLAATWTALANATRDPNPDSWAYNLPGRLMSRLATLFGPDTIPAQAIARHLPVSALRIRATLEGFEASLFLPAGYTLQSPP